MIIKGIVLENFHKNTFCFLVFKKHLISKTICVKFKLWRLLGLGAEKRILH